MREIHVENNKSIKKINQEICNTKTKNIIFLNKKNGITLIALVVTIVVLLILAGITINMLFGTDGIFKVAGNAANEWNEAVANEQTSLETITGQIQNLVNGQVDVGAEDIIGGATEGLKEGNIIATEPIWQNGTASITLSKGSGVASSLTIQYQIGGVEEKNWQTEAEGANIVTVTELKHNDTVYARLTDGTNNGSYASVDILDGQNPQQAQITGLSGTSTTTTGSITATITHVDNESGVDIANCRWAYNTNASTMGTEISSYPSENKFSSNGQQITLSATTLGTYYLHVLTVDKAGNKIETISQAITVTQLVTGITLNQTSATLTEGETLQLTATVAPDNTNNKTLTWSSNNDTVASVSANGLVTAKTAGTAIITVKANDGSGVTATCTVRVKKLATEVNELEAGDWVRYEDGTGVERNCVVLYDSSSSYGVEIITMESVEDVKLGEDDPTVSGADAFTKCMNSYNNAISTLNNATSKYLNTVYSNESRSVGSVPNSPSSESEMYTRSESWFSDYNEKFRDSDENYLIDNKQMLTLGIRDIDDVYWFASRSVSSNSTLSHFNIRNTSIQGHVLCSVYSHAYVASSSNTYGLRPIFQLKSEIKVTAGTGEEENPYILGM